MGFIDFVKAGFAISCAGVKFRTWCFCITPPSTRLYAKTR